MNGNKPGSNPAFKVDSTFGRRVLTVPDMASQPGFTAAATENNESRQENKIIL
jgi:hypothetical protein